MIGMREKVIQKNEETKRRIGRIRNYWDPEMSLYKRKNPRKKTPDTFLENCLSIDFNFIFK